MRVVLVVRHELLFGVSEHAVIGRILSGSLHDLVHFFHGRFTASGEAEVNERHIHRRDAHRHAVEAAEGYRLGHGTCVAIGMVAIASASVTAELCPEELPERLARLIKAHGLSLAFDAAPDKIFDEALHDKKRSGSTIDLVVPRGIGAASLAPTPLDEFRRILEVGLACTQALSAEIDGEEDPC